MTPPVSANALAGHGVGECLDWSVRRLENDSTPLDELQGGSAIHHVRVTLLTHAAEVTRADRESTRRGSWTTNAVPENLTTGSLEPNLNLVAIRIGHVRVR